MFWRWPASRVPTPMGSSSGTRVKVPDSQTGGLQLLDIVGSPLVMAVPKQLALAWLHTTSSGVTKGCWQTCGPLRHRTKSAVRADSRKIDYGPFSTLIRKNRVLDTSAAEQSGDRISNPVHVSDTADHYSSCHGSGTGLGSSHSSSGTKGIVDTFSECKILAVDCDRNPQRYKDERCRSSVVRYYKAPLGNPTWRLY